MATNDQKSQARAKREQAQAAAMAAQRRTRNIQILGGTVFAAILVVVLVVIISGGKDTPDGGLAEGKDVQGVAVTNELFEGIPQQGLTLGDPKAPVTIVEFLDVQCSHCRDHALDDQPTVIKELVRTGKARITAQPIALPQFGEDSEAGRAVAVRLSRENKAWDFLNLFFNNQGNAATGYVTDQFLRDLTSAAGADTALAQRTPDAETADALRKIDDLSKELGVTGTPSFAIGKTGQPASSYELLRLQGGSISDQLVKAVDDFQAKT